MQAQQPLETLVLHGGALSFSFNVGVTESVVLSCNHFGWREVIFGLPAIIEMLKVFGRLSECCRVELEGGNHKPLDRLICKLRMKKQWLRTALRKLPPRVLCALERGMQLSPFLTFNFPAHTPKEAVMAGVREMIALLHKCVELYVCYDDESTIQNRVHSICSCMSHDLDTDNSHLAAKSYIAVAACKASVAAAQLAGHTEGHEYANLQQRLRDAAAPFPGWHNELVVEKLLPPPADGAAVGEERKASDGRAPNNQMDTN